MLVVSIVALAVAVLSVVVSVLSVAHAGRSADAAQASVAEAKRSADAAERAAAAATITADADKAEDHRKREPGLQVTVEEKAEHDGRDVIYRVRNTSPLDIDSVVVHRPEKDPADGRVVHQVARTGGKYGEEADLGPIKAGTYERFTLSLGSAEVLPDFHVKIVCSVGEESWPRVVPLDQPRRPKPPPSPRRVR